MTPRKWIPSNALVKVLRNNVPGHIVNTPEGKLWMEVISQALIDRKEDFTRWSSTQGFRRMCEIIGLDHEFVIELRQRFDRWKSANQPTKKA